MAARATRRLQRWSYQMTSKEGGFSRKLKEARPYSRLSDAAVYKAAHLTMRTATVRSLALAELLEAIMASIRLRKQLRALMTLEHD